MQDEYTQKNKKGLRKKISSFFHQKIHHTVVVSLLFFIIIPAIGFGFWYGYNALENISFKIEKISNEMARIDSRLSSTTKAFEKNIARTQESLNKEISEQKKNVESKLSNVENKMGNISGSVTELEKMSKIDEELLKKYSKVFFLNEHYAPSELTEIPDKYKYYEDKTRQFHTKVWPFLKNMLNSAERDGIELYVYSAYRSFDSQENIKDYYEVTYGEGTANTFSADQGYSEHQLGTTVDLITTGINGTLEGFGQTQAYDWLLNNAYKFGFTLSYPEDNGYYMFEPWHWRFVGVELATYLHKTDQHFYDLSQRKIDEYLSSLFD